MATKAYSITSGPATWNIAVAFLDRQERNPKILNFGICEQSANSVIGSYLGIRVTSLSFDPADKDAGSWQFKGIIIYASAQNVDHASKPVTGQYSVLTRKGRLEIDTDSVENEYSEYHAHGMDIVSLLGKITEIRCGSHKVALGQMVFSNGLTPEFAPNGTPGIVVKLHEPFTGSRSTNVIDVWFEGNHQPERVKFRELKKT